VGRLSKMDAQMKKKAEHCRNVHKMHTTAKSVLSGKRRAQLQITVKSTKIKNSTIMRVRMRSLAVWRSSLVQQRNGALFESAMRLY